MAPAKSAFGKGNKRKSLTVELKKAIVEDFEKGIKQKDIASKYVLHKNTVQTILANKEKIKNSKVSKGVTKLCAESQRKNCVDEMEKLLLIWINERQLRGDPTSQDIICEKARFVYESLKKKEQQERCLEVNKEEEKEFKASKGWFYRFCKRTGIRNVATLGVAGSCDKEAAENLQEVQENISSNDEKRNIKKGSVPTSVIKDVVTKWEDVRKIVAKWHPNHCEINQIGDLFENKAICYFRDVQKRREKQSTLDSFLNQSKKHKTNEINTNV